MRRGKDKHSNYERWINDYRAASSWIGKHDVERAVDANGGLVRIPNFLPEFVAEGILATVAAVPDEQWNDTSATADYRHNNISHSFFSVKNAKGLDVVLRLFSLVRPGSLNAFSAAKYSKRDHIAPHDDRAYTQVKLDTGRIIIASRTLAIIYYLTRDWREEYGGVLVDLEDPSCPEGGRKYVPQWNSVVAFRVPRYHAVTDLTTDRPRYSIFGWFLEPGELYELYREEEDGGKEGAHKGAIERRQAEAGGSGGGVQGRVEPAGAAAAQPASRRGAQPAAGGAGKQEAADGGLGGARPSGSAAPYGAAAKRPRNGGKEALGATAGVVSGKRQKPESVSACGAGRGPAGRGGARDSDKLRIGADVGLQPCAPARSQSRGGEPGAGARRGVRAPTFAPGLARAVRLPGRWQGRRKHVFVR